MDIYRVGSHYNFVVIAVTVPGLAIFRFQTCTHATNTAIMEAGTVCLLQIVGTLNPDVEWTAYNYGGPPAYADSGYRPPTGIYRYDFKFETKFNGGYYDTYTRNGIKIAELPGSWL